MYKGFSRFLIGVTAVSIMVGCASYKVPLKYETAATAVAADQSQQLLSMGQVTDSRGRANNWLGAIRGGFGNPLKKLYTDRPTNELVSDEFKAALQSRGLLAPESMSTYRVEVNILKFDTSTYFNKEAHAHLTVTLIYKPTDTTIFSKTYKRDNTKRGYGAGVFGSVEDLRKLANKTLNEAIDAALDDPAFRRALHATTPVPTAGG